MLGKMLENLRAASPLVHCITNYVTVNDCANILLACGASPIMADDTGEVEEITSICAALTINIGTLSRSTIPSMFLAGKRAAGLSHPIVLDPVGAGASTLRTKTALQLIKEIPFTVIRGNISEIRALAGAQGTTKGVDADTADKVTDETLGENVSFAKSMARSTGAVIVITGAIDIVADANLAYVLRNGHPDMSRITGSGCMLTAMMGAYLAANSEYPLEAAAAAVCAMGYCGELAHAALQRVPGAGNASFRITLIDRVCGLDGEMLKRGAQYEIR